MTIPADAVGENLGTFGGDRSEALDINDQNQIVGSAYYADGRIAGALWENDLASGTIQMIDLNERLAAVLRNVWYISEANAINDMGHIVAVADRKLPDGSTETHGVLLRPSTTGG